MSPGPTEVDVAVHPDVSMDSAALRREAARALGCSTREVGPVVIVRRGIDARRGRVRMALRLRVFEPGTTPPAWPSGPTDLPVLTGTPRVAIVGAGPAGMFCAHALARVGIRSIVFERGQPIRQRRHDLAALTQRGELNPESNYCFGEGGAGTFSDGKLYTRSRKRGPTEDVLRTFVSYGASPEILVSARPHIGTNKLPAVVTRMRAHLEDCGVEFAFGHRVDGIVLRGREIEVLLADDRRIRVQAVVVATGHSAREVHLWLQKAGARLTFKPFAVGVRLEHPQRFIDDLQFGALAGHPALGAASYRVVETLGERGIFSFCMCPGGFIVPATTESDAQVVNGWSPSSRRGRFANSGFVVELGLPEVAAAGFDPNDSLAGVALQRQLERRAFLAGGGRFVAPAQAVADFVEGRRTRDLPPCSYPRGLSSVILDDVLASLAAPLRAALRRIETRMPGFVSNDAVAVALESRTSSPVRIERDKNGEALGVPGLYPCAEGAGHAGGIMSAALDGLRIAAAIADRLGAEPAVSRA